MKTIHLEHSELEKSIQIIIAQSSKETKPKIYECEADYVVIIFEPIEKSTVPHNKIDYDTISAIYKMLDDDIPVKTIAKQLSLTPKTIYNYKNEKNGV